ncbi:hypothetical protein HII31_00937 [Pseudocercospora fuligena]|uniref:Uncharacterized protein n=1 Tax=Pseudocercospora fuligena TaxID=685502 RepID=A0A8H6VMI9_9PEZI|nr:hypothetical protein HII31_00937 [Pseudocercospora fuligena]
MSPQEDRIDFRVDSAQLTITDQEKALLKAFQDWYNHLQLVSSAREAENAVEPSDNHGNAEAMNTSCTAHNFQIPNRFVARRSSFPPGTFRFMQLPPELRGRVYTCVFENERNWENGLLLATLKLPSITRASKTIRKEALPQFYAEAPIHIPICANLFRRQSVRESARRLGGNGAYGFPPGSDPGNPHLKQKTRQCIRAAGEDARFKDLTFLVCDEWHNYYLKRSAPLDEILGILHLQVQQGKLKIDLEKGAKYARMEERDEDDWRIEYETVDYDAAMSDVRTKIDEIGSRPDFKGFSLNDVLQIAKAFRYYGPEKE